MNMMDSVLERLTEMAGQVGEVISSATFDGTLAAKLRTESEGRAFYEQISAEEDIQNLLTKYRLQLFQIREVNAEIIRRANISSTRMGRVQQVIGEQTNHMKRLQSLLAQGELTAIGTKLEETKRQMRDIERHVLQTELAMAALENVFEAGIADENEENSGSKKKKVQWK